MKTIIHRSSAPADHADATAEALERSTRRFWGRGQVTDADRDRRALTVAMRHGKNQRLVAERGYKMAEVTVRNTNWLGTSRSADADTRDALTLSRARGRDIEQNNPYGERYLSELESNVLGPDGMKLQMQVREWDASAKEGKGAWVPDERANEKVEAAWEEWKGLGQCDVTQDASFAEVEAMSLRAAAREGEILIRLVPNYENKFKFAVQLIESDFLDHNFTQVLANGNVVVMGVEMDQWRRRVAYHVLTQHPGDFYLRGFGRGAGASLGGLPSSSFTNRTRIDAKEIIHLRMMKRPGQTRGISWFAPVAEQLEMLRGYEEAELTSARAEACKGGHYYSDIVPEGGFAGLPIDPRSGDYIKEIEPGMMEPLPYGVKFQSYDPKHPNGNYSNYRKGVLRGIASGMLVSYNVLANDLEGVNYSSLRGGLLDEREIYKRIQAWFITRFEMQIFRAWLECAILSGNVKLPMFKFDKFNVPFFQGRRWDWVDPLKDIQAIELAIEAGLTSRREEAAKRGKDIRDVAIEQQQDAELSAEHGLKWGRPEAMRGSLNVEIAVDDQPALPNTPKEPDTDTTRPVDDSATTE